MSEERWFDVSTVGSMYEVQMSDQGGYRHRLLRCIGGLYGTGRVVGPWFYGPPPKPGG